MLRESPVCGNMASYRAAGAVGRAYGPWNQPVRTRKQRHEVFAGFLAVCQWTEVFFAWRPNLPDEADNHLVELAVAGGASAIVTRNTKDFERAELRFPNVRILIPERCLEVFA